jgi:hypothetical protein
MLLMVTEVCGMTLQACALHSGHHCKALIHSSKHIIAQDSQQYRSHGAHAMH